LAWTGALVLLLEALDGGRTAEVAGYAFTSSGALEYSCTVADPLLGLYRCVAKTAGGVIAGVGYVTIGAATTAVRIRSEEVVELDPAVLTQLQSIEDGVDANTGYLTSVLARIGSFTGTGVNNILGFFRAMFRSDASTPSDMGGTATAADHSLQAIRVRGDAEWDTGSATESDLMVSTTIATLASQTVFTLTAGSADNDVYNDQLVVITDSATSTQKARMLVSDYVGSTKTLTLASAPGFTVAAGDSVAIIAVAGLTAVQRNQLASIGASTRVTVRADLGTEISLKIGDTYAATRSTAKRIDVNDSDSSIYDMLTGDDIASIDFGLSNATTIDVVTGTVDPETVTHTAASGSVSAYTTVYVDVEVDADLKPFCGDYDIQITYDDETRQTPFGGKCELVRDFKA